MPSGKKPSQSRTRPSHLLGAHHQPTVSQYPAPWAVRAGRGGPALTTTVWATSGVGLGAKAWAIGDPYGTKYGVPSGLNNARPVGSSAWTIGTDGSCGTGVRSVTGRVSPVGSAVSPSSVHPAPATHATRRRGAAVDGAGRYACVRAVPLGRAGTAGHGHRLAAASAADDLHMDSRTYVRFSRDSHASSVWNQRRAHEHQRR